MYRAQPGLFDEMVDAEGRCSAPIGAPLLDRFDALGPDALSNRFEAADRHLKDSGVSFRVYDDADATERPWPLSHMPLLISPEDWKHIKAGVLQRVELIEALLADVYGPQNFIADGSLPAAAIAGSPRISAADGRHPAGGRTLSQLLPPSIWGRSPGGRLVGDPRPRARSVGRRLCPGKTATRCRARCPTSIAVSMSSGWPRSSKRIAAG